MDNADNTTQLIFITGGARSGKSKYAQELALSLSDSPVYVATAKVWDDDFEKRVNVIRTIVMNAGPIWKSNGM